MTTVTETPLMRLSTIRDCPRHAVYEAIGAPAREVYDRETRIMWSGRRIGQDYLDMWCEAHPGEELIREKKVPHPFGVGHEDAFIVSTGTVLEILSSAHASTEMVHSKLLQLVLYMTYDEAAVNGALLIVDPRDYSDERVIVVKGGDKWDELAAEAQERMEAVREWTTSGTLPGRVCARPENARGHFCRHAEFCFEGWMSDPVQALNDPDVHELAVRLAHVKAKRREIGSTDKTLEAEQKEIQSSLAEVVEPGEWRVGRVQLKRSPRSKPTFKLALAREDSRLPAELLEEFTSTSVFDVWDAQIVADEANADFEVDFGDTPF